MIDKHCKETVWLTPSHILDVIRLCLGGRIELDPATESNNPTEARYFFTKSDDGLHQVWDCVPSIFVNPPYGKDLLPWVTKICEEAARGQPILALLPGQRFETKVWQDLLLPHPNLTGICFVRGRIKFLRPSGEVAKSNPYGSMIYAFNIWSRLDELKALGHVWRTRN